MFRFLLGKFTLEQGLCLASRTVSGRARLRRGPQTRPTVRAPLAPGSLDVCLAEVLGCPASQQALGARLGPRAASGPGALTLVQVLPDLPWDPLCSQPLGTSCRMHRRGRPVRGGCGQLSQADPRVVPAAVVGVGDQQSRGGPGAPAWGTWCHPLRGGPHSVPVLLRRLGAGTCGLQVLPESSEPVGHKHQGRG